MEREEAKAVGLSRLQPWQLLSVCSDTVFHQDSLPDMVWLVASAVDEPPVGEAGDGAPLGGWGSSGQRDWGKGEELVEVIGAFRPEGAERWPGVKGEVVGVRVVVVLLQESKWVG